MNAKLMLDTDALASKISTISTEIDKFELSVENLVRSFDDIKKYWIGPDFNEYYKKVTEQLKSVQLLKLTLQDFLGVLNDLKLKIDSYQGF